MHSNKLKILLVSDPYMADPCPTLLGKKGRSSVAIPIYTTVSPTAVLIGHKLITTYKLSK